MNELYKLLKKYDGVVLDKEFLEEAFEIMLSADPSLLFLVSNLKVTDNDSDDTLGNYRLDDKLITVYLNNIKDKNIMNNTNNNNILALAVLKHELTHAENIRKLNQCRKDIETDVIKTSLLDYCTKNGLFYPLKEYDLGYIRVQQEDNYEIDPGERTTEIKAWKYLVNILKNKHLSNELLYARTQLYYSYIRGYKDNGIYINCPTYEYLLELRLMREYKLLKKKVENKKYNLDTRLTYGLPITYKEYNQEILNKVKLKKRKLKD